MRDWDNGIWGYWSCAYIHVYIAGNDAVDGQGHATLVTETYMSCIKGDKSQGDCWRKNSCILNSNRDLECC